MITIFEDFKFDTETINIANFIKGKTFVRPIADTQKLLQDKLVGKYVHFEVITNNKSYLNRRLYNDIIEDIQYDIFDKSWVIKLKNNNKYIPIDNTTDIIINITKSDAEKYNL